VIGPEVSIGPFCHVKTDCRMERTLLLERTTVEMGTKLQDVVASEETVLGRE